MAPTKQFRGAAAVLIPLAALSMFGCDETKVASGPKPYQPDPPARVDTTPEARPVRNENHQELVKTMASLDADLVRTLNAATVSIGNNTLYSVDKSLVNKLSGSIDATSEILLKTVDRTEDRNDLNLLLEYAGKVGEARGALDFSRQENIYANIPDGGYHTLHGLLAETRALMRMLTTPTAGQIFGE